MNVFGNEVENGSVKVEVVMILSAVYDVVAVAAESVAVVVSSLRIVSFQ